MNAGRKGPRARFPPYEYATSARGSSGARYGSRRTQSPTDEQAIRDVLKRFYDGWNAHDPEMMVSAYADDVDHIDVWGEWHKGKAEIRKDITWLHGPEGPARTSQKKYVVEKIRLMTQRPPSCRCHPQARRDLTSART